MSDTTSADPERLLGFVEDAVAFDASVTIEAGALGAALDRAIVTSGGHLAALPRVDDDMAGLARAAGDASVAAASVAARFLLADRGTAGGRLWPAPGRPDPRLPAQQRLASRMVGLLRDAAELTADELADAGRRLYGDGSWGRHVTTVWTLLTPLGGLSSVASGTTPAERLVELLTRVPALRPLASAPPVRAAVPWVRGVGRGLSAVGIAEDIERLVRDGEPVAAFEREGARYVASWAQLGLDVSATACAEAPSWATCGSAAVSAAGWVGLGGYVHREPLARGATAGAVRAALGAEALRRSITDGLDDIDEGVDRAIDGVAAGGRSALRSAERSPGLVRLPPVVVAGAEAVVERARVTAHRVKDGVKDVAERAGGTILRGASAVLP